MAEAKERPLTAKQADFIRFYTDAGSGTHNNGTQSALKAGYSIKGAEVRANELLSNSKVRAEIERYKAKVAVKLEHNRDIAIHELNTNLSALNQIIEQNKGKAGIVSAINARTAVLRELNAISNLHSQTITQEVKEQPIPAAELDIIQDQTRIMNLKLAKQAV